LFSNKMITNRDQYMKIDSLTYRLE